MNRYNQKCIDKTYRIFRKLKTQQLRRQYHADKADKLPTIRYKRYIREGSWMDKQHSFRDYDTKDKIKRLTNRRKCRKFKKYWQSNVSTFLLLS